MKTKLKNPTSQIQEVLYLLIKNNYPLSRVFFTNHWILNAPVRILELRRIGVDIDLQQTEIKNKFGRKIKYGAYFLRDRDDAIETYKKLTKDE